MLRDLPPEIIDSISKYLCIRDYYRLKSVSKSLLQTIEAVCSKTNNGAKVPKFHLSALKKSVKYIKKARENAKACGGKSIGPAAQNVCGGDASEPFDPSMLMRLDTLVLNLNSFSFLVRYGFSAEFCRIYSIPSHRALLSLDQKSYLMELATGSMYDETVNSFNVDDEFDYYPQIVYSLLKFDNQDRQSMKVNKPSTSTDISATTSVDIPPTTVKWRFVQLITIACFMNDLETFKFIFKKQPKKASIFSLLQCSIARSCESICLYILDNCPDIDPSQEDNSCLAFACKNGNLSIVQKLLSFPSVTPTITCFLGTITFNQPRIARLFLNDSRFTNPGAHDNLLLGACIHFKRTSIFAMLLSDSRVSPEANNCDLLNIAIQERNSECVRLLLEDERVVVSGHVQLAAIRVLMQ